MHRPFMPFKRSAMWAQAKWEEEPEVGLNTAWKERAMESAKLPLLVPNSATRTGLGSCLQIGAFQENIQMLQIQTVDTVTLPPM